MLLLVRFLFAILFGGGDAEKSETSGMGDGRLLGWAEMSAAAGQDRGGRERKNAAGVLWDIYKDFR